MMTVRNCMLCVALAGLVPACTPSVVQGTTQTPAHDVGSGRMPMANPPLIQAVWPAKTREHIDLWLHSYALITQDTTLIPYFRRGYANRVNGVRRQRGVTSLIDTNRAQLLARIAVEPSLSTNGQFLPMYYTSWEQMRGMIDLFVRSNGDPGSRADQITRANFGVLGSAFPTAADREWLRLFTASVDDESIKFHHGYWTSESASRAAVIGHADSLWQRQWRPALQRFLNNTQQQNGDLYLSFPLGGEGRTVHYDAEHAVAGPMPESAAESESILYVMAHEIMGVIASQAIADNTTPADQRSGGTARYEQPAAVRAGALLLERTVPLAVNGYMRFYLLQAGKASPTNPRDAFAAAFPITDAMRDTIIRQLDVILGGI
ncbi:MAG: hypothetical protein JWM95_4665 [Gemmatimonadetes bacterium]|nr:hypothetical protein [Gemmatimonadota bacterium]